MPNKDNLKFCKSEQPLLLGTAGQGKSIVLNSVQQAFVNRFKFELLKEKDSNSFLGCERIYPSSKNK